MSNVIKLTVHAFSQTKPFARNVLSQLVVELMEVNAQVTLSEPLAATDVSPPPVVALIYSTAQELKWIRNGSVPPNLSFQITPCRTESYARDYTVCTLVAAIHRILLELNPNNLTVLRMPEGLKPESLEIFRGQTVELILN